MKHYIIYDCHKVGLSINCRSINPRTRDAFSVTDRRFWVTYGERYLLKIIDDRVYYHLADDNRLGTKSKNKLTRINDIMIEYD